MKKIALAAFSATALLALSACGDAAEEPVAEDTAVVEEAPIVDPATDTTVVEEGTAEDAMADDAMTEEAPADDATEEAPVE